MKHKYITPLYLICLLFLLISDIGFAHTFERVDNVSKATWSKERLAFMPIDRIHPHSTQRLGNPGLESVIVLPNKWAQKQELHVCFYGGNDELRKKILSIIKTWTDLTNLKISSNSGAGVTCQDKDISEIRIGFNEPGYWSYIGNDSISTKLISNNLSSMNLEGFDVNPPAEPRFSGIIFHEVGHALALHHEHQSPVSGCNMEYDWPKLYSYYKTNYGWDKKKVDDNLKPLMADRSAYDWSMIDIDSIMIYKSDPKFLKRGVRSKCYFHDNNKLSSLDVKGIQQTYPKDNADAVLEFQERTIPIVL